MKKLLPVLCFLLAFSASAFSQSKEDEAKVLYQKAETLYEGIKNSQTGGYSDTYSKAMVATNKKNYIDAVGYLDKATALIGTNPKIVYLRIRLVADGIPYGAFENSEQNYQGIKNMLSMFFAMADKNTYPPEKYTEMINMKIDADEKLKPFAEVKLQKQRYEESMMKREAGFLRDTFDVYMQKFVKSFEYYSAAKFDDNAENHVTRELEKQFVHSFSIKEQRRAMEEQSGGGPFPHHLQYDPATKQLYIYYYKPEKGNYSGYCCPDTIYTLGGIVYAEESKPLGYYSSTDKKFVNRSNYTVFPLDSVIFRNKVNYRSTPVKFRYTAGKTPVRYYVDITILNRLMELLGQSGFDQYLFYNTVFAYSTPNGEKMYFKNLGGTSWGKFIYPNKEPAFTYQLVESGVGQTILYDNTTSSYIRLTHNQYLTGHDKGNINDVLFNGKWMMVSQIGVGGN